MDDFGLTFPDKQVNYTVEYDEDQGGMEVLYDITNVFLDSVTKGNIFPDGFLTEEKFPDFATVTSDFGTEVIANAQDIIVNNIPILVCIILGLILAFVTFIVGCTFCCCGCQGKHKKSKEGGNGCKKILLTVLLFILLVFTSLGCMWFFLGAKTFKKGIDQVPEDLDDVLHDGDLFINTTADQLSYLLKDNFLEVIANFNDTLNDVGQNFTTFTENMKKETKLEDILKDAESYIVLVNQYPDIQNGVTEVFNSYKIITDGLGNIKREGDLLFSCDSNPDQEICKMFNEANEIFNNPGIPDLNIALPDLPPEANQLSTLSSTLQDISKQIDSISDDAINTYFPGINDQIDDITDDLLQYANDLTDQISDITISDIIPENINDMIDEIWENYLKYFHISLLVLGSLLVVILAFFFVGMCLGSCSKQGSGMASTGSGMMFWANSVFFFLAIFLFILCTVFFTVGSLSDKIICKTMKNPESSELVTFLNPLISSELENFYNNTDCTTEVDIAKLIADIHNNTAIYPLLQLQCIFDVENLTDWKETYGIEELIKEARDKVQDVISSLVNFEDDINKNDIISAANEIDKYMNEINIGSLTDKELITNLNLAKENIKKLKDSIAAAAAGVPIPTIDEEFNKIIAAFDTLVTKTTTLQESLTDIMNSFGNEASQFDMSGRVERTLSLVDEAFVYFKGDAVTNFFNASVESLTKVVDDYVEHAIDAAENHIGKTEPLSNIYNATYTDFCLQIITPFNTVWSGLGWCLLMLLIPVSLVVSFLRNLFTTKEDSQSMRPYNNNSTKRPNNPVARAVSYEEVPMPSLSERNTRIHAYDSRVSQHGPSPSGQSSYQHGPYPHPSQDMHAQYRPNRR